jgi:hypothetical protein
MANFKYSSDLLNTIGFTGCCQGDFDALDACLIVIYKESVLSAMRRSVYTAVKPYPGRAA